jgi:carbamoyltransferase
MRIFGVNETTHDAAVAVIDGGEILFAGHAERYSKEKNDWFTNDELIADALTYGGSPDRVAYYEKRWLKRQRIARHGGFGEGKPYYKETILGKVPSRSYKHHYSHACAGYYTSPFIDAAIVVLDAIGEYETSTIWTGEGRKIKQVYSETYPVSFGLFYSAFTQLVGLKPNEEEYIMMGMAAYGDENRYYDKVRDYFPVIGHQKYNFHQGITGWDEVVEAQARFDIAAAVQRVFEERLIEFMGMAKSLTGKRNLVFMGGCALNSKANTLLWQMFSDVWIMPNPGDAGSALGAAAAMYGDHLNWKSPYLGHDLGGRYPVDKILRALAEDKIAPVASGRAEYGPRALGNRSILADPRDPDIKDKVNTIKKRELFRPFAPVVLAEEAHNWFDMRYASPYMQYTPRALKPEMMPSVVHADGTSRVQTVTEGEHPGLYAVLKKWHNLTGVPVLLNTSLNIKGQPILNDRADVEAWERHYKKGIIS